MQIPLQITFRNMEPSPAIEQAVREKMAKLEEFHSGIIGCRVVIETPHRRHHQGKLVHVRIDLTVPGSELVVRREPELNHAHEDAYVALRDAFDSVKRQLEDHIRQRRGAVKTHETPSEGRIARLFPEQDYGFIQLLDGREVYFHRNSVLGAGFDRLAVGDTVRIAEEIGEKGPQATTVHRLG